MPRRLRMITTEFPERTRTAAAAEFADAASRARWLAGGALIWLVYSLLSLALNGVALDELVTPAQIIAGAVQYPPGHPHEIAYLRFYSLLDYVAAGLWLLVPSADFVAGVFNVLWVFLTGFVPFAAALVLTGSGAWAFGAGALAVAGAAIPFQGTYPMWAFPNYYTNGHVGAHVAVLAVVLLAGRHWRAGGALLGLLPAIHASMAAVVWPWAALYVAVARPWRGGAGRSFGGWFVAGLAVCAALAAAVALRSAGAGPAAPYDATAARDVVYRTFTAITDYHRHLFTPTSLGYGAAAAAFFGLVGLHAPRPSGQDAAGTGSAERERVLWLGAFGALVWVAVYGTWLLRVAGVTLPEPAEILMPFRFSNLTALLLVPLALALLWRETRAGADGRTPAAALVALVFAGLLLLLVLRDRWFVGRNVLFALWALGLGLAFARGPGIRRLVAGATAGAIGALLAAAFPSVGVAVGFGASFGLAVAGIAILRVVSTRGLPAPRAASAEPRVRATLAALATPRAAGAALLALGLSLSALSLPGHRGIEPWQRPTAFDAQLRSWLDRNALPDEPVLHAVTYEELQPRIGRPMLFHWTTLYLMTYMPDLAPVINAMTRDLFGVDYARPETIPACEGPQGQVRCAAWLRAWPGRGAREWQALRDKYGVRFVLSPNDVPLRLKAVLRGEAWSLYEIGNVRE